MNKRLIACLLALLLASLAGNARAQDWGTEYHPGLADNFVLSLGAYASSNAFKLRTTGRERYIDGKYVDFDDSIGVDKDNTIFNGQLRWKFGRERKWSLWGQYFENDAKGDATLEEDVEWQGIIFREGTFVEGGVKVAITRLFFGRSFFKRPQHDFGLGIGVHNLDLSAYIGGEIRINDESTGYHRADASASQILPNVGGWYGFSPHKRWLLHGRVDWISADVGDFDGTMWNVNAGVNFQAWRHVGFDLSYQYFNLDLRVKDKNWTGGAELTYSGPMISVIFNW